MFLVKLAVWNDLLPFDCNQKKLANVIKTQLTLLIDFYLLKLHWLDYKLEIAKNCDREVLCAWSGNVIRTAIPGRFFCFFVADRVPYLKKEKKKKRLTSLNLLTFSVYLFRTEDQRVYIIFLKSMNNSCYYVVYFFAFLVLAKSAILFCDGHLFAHFFTLFIFEFNSF